MRLSTLPLLLVALVTCEVALSGVTSGSGEGTISTHKITLTWKG